MSLKKFPVTQTQAQPRTGEGEAAALPGDSSHGSNEGGNSKEEEDPAEEAGASCGSATAGVSSIKTFERDGYEWGHPVSEEVYLSLRNIRDPEKPYTLEELGVITPECICVYCNPAQKDLVELVNVRFIPTSPVCSLATLIGLCIMDRLALDIPREQGFPKFSIEIRDGDHENAAAIAKQLNDKERRYAAMENPDIKRAVKEACAMEEED